MTDEAYGKQPVVRMLSFAVDVRCQLMCLDRARADSSDHTLHKPTRYSIACSPSAPPSARY